MLELEGFSGRTEYVSAMQQPVEDCGGEHLVAGEQLGLKLTP